LRVGIYLGDIKKPKSVSGLTFELSFVDKILKTETEHEFVFYYFGKRNIFKNRENARFVSLNYIKKPNILSYCPINIKSEKIPIIPLNYILKHDNINLVFFLTPYIKEYIEIPYFAIIRDVAHRILPHFPEFSISKKLIEKEKKFNAFLAGATQIITCSELAKEDIRTIYDVIDENIITLPLPTPVWMEGAKDDIKFLQKNNLLNSSYILYPAQFWTHKNHIRLILSAQIMKEQNINLKTVFCGLDRGNKKYLKEQVKELDLQDDVIFLDYVEQDELATLYKNAYALVYPSLAGVDSISALEAMYFNCPVIISNHTGYEMQLKTSALYINPLDENDIIDKIELLNDLAIKDEILAKGKNLIKENNFQNYVDKIINIIDNFYLTRACWSLCDNYTAK